MCGCQGKPVNLRANAQNTQQQSVSQTDPSKIVRSKRIRSIKIRLKNKGESK